MTEANAGGGAVTAAEIIRNFGFWQQRALAQPLTITHHGRARVMMISAEEYERLHQNAPAGGAPPDIDMLADNLREGFVMHDADLRVVKINRAAEAFLGARRDELLGFDVKGGRPEGPAALQNVLKRVLRTGEIVEYEADSALFPGRKISLRSFPYRDGVATLFLNQTEHERLRLAADELEASRAAIAATGRVGLARIDGKGMLASADSCFERIAGAALAELVTRNLIERVAAPDRDRVQLAFAKARAEAQASVLTLRIEVPEGSREVTLGIAPLMRDLQVDGVMLALSET